jgi:hypothetical protein
VTSARQHSGKSSLALDTLYAEGQRRYARELQPATPASSSSGSSAPRWTSWTRCRGHRRGSAGAHQELPLHRRHHGGPRALLSALFTGRRCPCARAAGCWPGGTEADDAAEQVRGSLGSPRGGDLPAAGRGHRDYLAVRERLAQDGYRRLWLGGEVRDLDAVAQRGHRRRGAHRGRRGPSSIAGLARRERAASAAASRRPGAAGGGLARAIGDGKEARVARGSSCPVVRPLLRGARARAVLVPVADGRVPRLPGLRPHHRHRLGEGRPRRAPLDPPRGDPPLVRQDQPRATSAASC